MRFIQLFLVALLVFMAGTVMAEVKAPDTVNIAGPVAKSFQTPVTGLLTAASGTYNRIYTNGSVNALCSAETFDSVNDGMYYDVICFQTDSYEPIELNLDINGTDLADAVLTIYCSPFNPLHPDQNVIAFDDDSGLGTLSAITLDMNVALIPSTEYWAVISTYGANMTGAYALQRSNNVFDCGIVADDAASWGSLKGMYR